MYQLDQYTEWECSRDHINIIKEIEHDHFGKICKGSVRSQKGDNDDGSVMLRILKGKWLKKRTVQWTSE